MNLVGRALPITKGRGVLVWLLSSNINRKTNYSQFTCPLLLSRAWGSMITAPKGPPLVYPAVLQALCTIISIKSLSDYLKSHMIRVGNKKISSELVQNAM